MLWWVICLGAALIVFLLVRSVSRESPSRISLVVAADPVHVVSFDSKRNRVVVIDVAQDTVISAVRGYGAYRVGALAELDRIDKHHGSLLTESIADNFGMPITGYVHEKGVGDGSATIDTLRSLFSWESIGGVLFGSIERTVPLSTWVSLVFSVQSLKAEAVVTIDIRDAIVDQSEPDGSSVKILDQSRLDYLLDGQLIDSGIRAEGRTVSVVNTTTMPGLGQRLARQLGRIGIQVVSVESEESPIGDCMVSGASEALASKTARFITSSFRCKTEARSGEGGVSDIVVRIGTEFASHFLPTK